MYANIFSFIKIFYYIWGSDFKKLIINTGRIMSKTPIKPKTISDEVLVNKIYEFRGQKVMLDSDLAELYGVETKRLNEQVRRNTTRFPGDFMFTLDKDEIEILKSQIATSS